MHPGYLLCGMFVQCVKFGNLRNLLCIACIQLFILLIMALQLFMQSFGLSTIHPSSSILDKGLPVWYFWLLYVFSNTILLAYLWSSIGLLEMGFQEYIALTILVSCILSMWPSHSSLSVLMKFMFLCFIILYLLIFLELLTSLLAYFVIPISVWQVHHHCCNDHQDEIQYCCCSDGRWWRGYLIIALASH